MSKIIDEDKFWQSFLSLVQDQDKNFKVGDRITVLTYGDFEVTGVITSIRENYYADLDLECPPDSSCGGCTLYGAILLLARKEE